ncbi:MAG TPA: SRPBCC family protein [Candidatus Dormibacteraeota bacterium]|nr:SRPBCC family protein [Candidatus Dormibacteraeota bacterium]HVC22811.1 SRPBCC family protein [Candidatus Dormibacteraeota bacterium]
MSGSFVAKSEITVDVSPEAVWRALTDPEMVSQYMYGTVMETSWEVGSPITWSGEWEGKSYQDKGTVLDVVPQRRLMMTYWSSMSGRADQPENYLTVTYELAETEGGVKLTLTQDNNASQEEADSMAERNWGPVLKSLKAAAEARGEL